MEEAIAGSMWLVILENIKRTEEPWEHCVTGNMLQRPCIMQIKGPISRTHALIRSAVGWSMARGCFPIQEVFKGQLGVKGCMYKDIH